MSASPSSPFALILPGAVTRGAYEAGVISVLAEQNVKIDRIVATSSGALNGLAFAAGIRSGRKVEMANLLVRSWRERGGWRSTLSMNPLSLLAGRGLSDQSGLLSLMRTLIKPCESVEKFPVELWLILTPLNGVVSHIGRRPATSYEAILKFRDEDFDTQESLEKIFKVVAAACSFPGLFETVDIEGLGPCVDGGAVNNAPIGYALSESNIKRILIPVPFPSVMKPGAWKKGLSLLNHLIQILINERLYRDLKQTQAINDRIKALEKLVHNGILSADQLQAVESALGMRKIELTQIRPGEALKQSPFAGFFSENERDLLIEEGRHAAIASLGLLPAHNPDGQQTTE
jgi:predicted acylesterase/phospholipase RssA